MSSSDSQDISTSDARASEESPSSSLSTGSSSPVPRPRSIPNPNIPEPQPVNRMPGQVFAERVELVSDKPAPYDPDNETRDQWVERQITPNAHQLLNAFMNICVELKIDPSLRLFLFLFEVLPGKSGCDGYVYFRGRNGRQFISDLPQSNRQWKEKFVFIRFPTDSPLAGIRWNDHILKPENTEPATAPDLEESLGKLLQGDPFTGQMFHYGAWIWRIQLGGKGTPRAHGAAGHGVPTPGNTAEAGAQATQKTGSSSSATAKNKPVQPETVVIHDKEEDPQTKGIDQSGNAAVNPSPNKGKGKKRVKHAATTHPSSKKRRGEHSPVNESMEKLWVKMTLKLREQKAKMQFKFGRRKILGWSPNPSGLSFSYLRTRKKKRIEPATSSSPQRPSHAPTSLPEIRSSFTLQREKSFGYKLRHRSTRKWGDH
ncbi:unnamed protein product [Cuscuta campestris]|uniref:Uncharacterized protein n=1 Tax=Cuscuta campestris TaxID=132261 RepID=A0A484M1W8_9ASTE|nr:unnamed protein product [Cuscuta campestris]